MDTGLGMEGGINGHMTRDGRWDLWVIIFLVVGDLMKCTCTGNNEDELV